MKKTFRTTGIVLVMAALLTACVSTTAPTAAPQVAATTQAPSAALTTGSASGAALASQQNSFEQVYALANPSVVNIQVVIGSTNNTSSQGNLFNNIPGFASPQQQTPTQALGSGFVYDTQGDIVTNNHVIDNATRIVVTFADGTQAAAKLVGADPGSDLAVIKVNVDPSLLKPLALADFSSVKVGEIVAAIGNPFGLQGSMSTGIVSGLGRMLDTSTTANLPNSSNAHFSIPDMIQTDTAINPGNSGGPLLNLDGQVIGVNSAIESSSGTNSGVGYAIPSSIVKIIADALIKNGSVEHAWLGITGQTLTADLATAMKLNADQRGVLLVDIAQGGPADKAGLRGSSKTVTIDGIDYSIGGDIITSLNGTPVNQIDDLLSYIFLQVQPGQKVSVGIIRDGKAMTVDVTLEARPSSNN